jgi:hypothetical protein
MILRVLVSSVATTGPRCLGQVYAQNNPTFKHILVRQFD